MPHQNYLTWVTDSTAPFPDNVSTRGAYSIMAKTLVLIQLCGSLLAPTGLWLRSAHFTCLHIGLYSLCICLWSSITDIMLVSSPSSSSQPTPLPDLVSLCLSDFWVSALDSIGPLMRLSSLQPLLGGCPLLSLLQPHWWLSNFGTSENMWEYWISPCYLPTGAGNKRFSLSLSPPPPSLPLSLSSSLLSPPPPTHILCPPHCNYHKFLYMIFSFHTFSTWWIIE